VVVLASGVGDHAIGFPGEGTNTCTPGSAIVENLGAIPEARPRNAPRAELNALSAASTTGPASPAASAHSSRMIPSTASGGIDAFRDRAARAALNRSSQIRVIEVLAVSNAPATDSRSAAAFVNASLSAFPDLPNSPM
jgi:hypothetical protein